MKRPDTALTGPQTAISASAAVTVPVADATTAHRDLSGQAGGGTVFVAAPRNQQRRQALCTCGWAGPSRLILRAIATTDAHIHARQEGCKPAWPLIRFGLSNVSGGHQ